MKNSENKEAKTLGYRLGQMLATVVAMCIMALLVGITIAILCRIF